MKNYENLNKRSKMGKARGALLTFYTLVLAMVAIGCVYLLLSFTTAMLNTAP